MPGCFININSDNTEVAKFSSREALWWDRNSYFKALHDINPVRIDYISKRTGGLYGKSVLDVGCGGGILSEALAAEGGTVTAIDLSQPSLSIAKAHGRQSGLLIDYACITAEELAESAEGYFDIVTCMELVEHVPYPESLVRACGRLTRPGGDVFFATINRTPVAYLLVVLAAEYVFGIIRKGMHSYRKFIRPVELKSWAGNANLTLQNLSGLRYIPFIRKSTLCRNVSMNYLMHFKKNNFVTHQG
jgi:2-polyprenyl-6-hydroxyphenyl methylase/3-demethylubiquinone-9 3-methyltransferase